MSSFPYFFVVIFLPLTNLVDVATLLIDGDVKPEPELNVCILENPPALSNPGNSDPPVRPWPPPKHKSPEFPNPNPANGDMPNGDRCPPKAAMRGEACDGDMDECGDGCDECRICCCVEIVRHLASRKLKIFWLTLCKIIDRMFYLYNGPQSSRIK